jgi:hypothetical protein
MVDLYIPWCTCHQKRKGRCFLCVWFHDVGCIDLIGIVEIVLRQKEGYYKYYFYIYILRHNKLYHLSSMDFKGLDLSRFPLKEPTGCLMRVAAHTSTTKIPQVQSRHHHMVLFRNLTKTQNIISECDLIHFIASPCSHYLVGTLFLEWPHCTFTLRPPIVKDDATTTTIPEIFDSFIISLVLVLKMKMLDLLNSSWHSWHSRRSNVMFMRGRSQNQLLPPIDYSKSQSNSTPLNKLRM